MFFSFFFFVLNVNMSCTKHMKCDQLDSCCRSSSLNNISAKEKIANSASADSQTTPSLAPHWFKPAGTRAAFTCSGVFCKHTIVFTEALSDFTYIDFERTQLLIGIFFVFIEAFRGTWSFSRILFTIIRLDNEIFKKSVICNHQILGVVDFGNLILAST